MGDCFSAQDPKAQPHLEEIDKRLKEGSRKLKKGCRILVLDSGKSGKNTIVRQTKIMHKNRLHDRGLSPDDHSQRDSSLKLQLDVSLYVPPAQSVHTFASSDGVCQHRVHSRLFSTSQSTCPDPLAQRPHRDYDPCLRQHPPAIHTLELLYPSDLGDFTPSPISSPTNNPGASQPTFTRQFLLPPTMSAPHTQTAFPQRFPTESNLARMPFTNPTLDRRVSELAPSARRPTYVQSPSSQHDVLAHSGASYTRVTQSSPLSPHLHPPFPRTTRARNASATAAVHESAPRDFGTST